MTHRGKEKCETAIFFLTQSMQNADPDGRNLMRIYLCRDNSWFNLQHIYIRIRFILLNAIFIIKIYL